MSSKLMIALGVLVAVAATTFVQFNAEQASDQLGMAAEAGVAALDTSSIDRLEIAAPNKTAITLLKQGDLWRVESPVQALASQSAVKAALEKLAELKVSGIAATNAKNHQRLEVTENTAVKVIAKQGKKVLADLRVGAYRAGNTMVRRAGRDEVASVQGSIRYAFDKNLKDFRDRTINALDVAEVQTFELTGPEGKITLVKNGESFGLPDGEPAPEHFDALKAKSLVSSVARLTATDFAAPDITAEATDFESGTTISLTVGTEEPTTTRLSIGAEKGGLFYLRKEGSEIIHRISKHVGGRLSGSPSELVTVPEVSPPPP